MDINWSLLQPVDIGGQFQRGYQGSVQNALAMDETRHRLQERQRAEGLRNALTGAYSPQTGQLDPQRARAAYLQAGDVGGAMQLDTSLRQRQSQVTERQREQIKIGARIIRAVNPTDDAGWQQVLALARQAGVDLQDVPTTFDANYVQSVVAAGNALEERGSEPFTLNPGDVRYDARGNVIARGGPRPPHYIAVPPGGRLELEPGTGGDPPPVLTDEDIRRLEQGGPSPNGSGTFPGN